jgi:hypothetical protein
VLHGYFLHIARTGDLVVREAPLSSASSALGIRDFTGIDTTFFGNHLTAAATTNSHSLGPFSLAL